MRTDEDVLLETSRASGRAGWRARAATGSASFACHPCFFFSFFFVYLLQVVFLVSSSAASL